MGLDEAVPGYCSFTKAIEHLGDRWTLLIMRQLAVGGAAGFNDLAGHLPGGISRSVLADRLRRLESLGLVNRVTSGSRQTAYQLTTSGTGLVPTLLSFRDWAASWFPDDVAMLERDPDVIFAWLANRLHRERLPDRQVVVELLARHQAEHRSWLVLERGCEPYGCLHDPLLDQRRYVYVTAGLTVLLALARGRLGWAHAMASGSLLVSGDPELIRQLPGWFAPADDGEAPLAGRPTVGAPAPHNRAGT